MLKVRAPHPLRPGVTLGWVCLREHRRLAHTRVCVCVCVCWRGRLGVACHGARQAILAHLFGFSWGCAPPQLCPPTSLFLRPRVQGEYGVRSLLRSPPGSSTWGVFPAGPGT